MIVSTSVIIAAVAVLLYMSATMRNKVNEKGGCPECGTPVPTFRHPTSLRQAFWGGWTCAECGTEMNQRGEEIAK